MTKFSAVLFAVSAAFATPAFTQDYNISRRVDSGKVVSSTGGEMVAAEAPSTRSSSNATGPIIIDGLMGDCGGGGGGGGPIIINDLMDDDCGGGGGDGGPIIIND